MTSLSHIYNIDLVESDDWEILPDCPCCHQTIERAKTEYTIIQEITNDHYEIVEDDHTVPQLRVDTWDEWRETIGAVEPCGHKFHDEGELYYYILSYRWLHGQLEQMEEHGIESDPVMEALDRKKQRVRQTVLY